MADKEITEKSDTFYLRFSSVCKPFGLPQLPEVARTAMNYFFDPSMNVDFERMGSDTIYKFEVSNEIDSAGHKLVFKVQGEVHKIELEASKPQRGFHECLLITFQNAAQKKFNKIPNSEFDKHLTILGFNVIKPTERQKIKDHDIYNSNRYAVISAPKDTNTIPDSLPIVDPETAAHHQVRISFKGQARHCGRCNGLHVGQCRVLPSRRRKS